MSVCVTREGEIVVADTRILVLDMEGNIIREFGWRTLQEGCRGRYQVMLEWSGDDDIVALQGLALDRNGLLLAVRSDKV